MEITKHKYRIKVKEFPTAEAVYYAQMKHPWFACWMYLSKFTGRLYFTTINYGVNYDSLEDAHKRIDRSKKDTLRIKEIPKSNKSKICLKL